MLTRQGGVSGSGLGNWREKIKFNLLLFKFMNLRWKCGCHVETILVFLEVSLGIETSLELNGSDCNNPFSECSLVLFHFFPCLVTHVFLALNIEVAQLWFSVVPLNHNESILVKEKWLWSSTLAQCHLVRFRCGAPNPQLHQSSVILPYRTSSHTVWNPELLHSLFLLLFLSLNPAFEAPHSSQQGDAASLLSQP